MKRRTFLQGLIGAAAAATVGKVLPAAEAKTVGGTCVVPDATLDFRMLSSQVIDQIRQREAFLDLLSGERATQKLRRGKFGVAVVDGRRVPVMYGDAVGVLTSIDMARE